MAKRGRPPKKPEPPVEFVRPKPTTWRMWVYIEEHDGEEIWDCVDYMQIGPEFETREQARAYLRAQLKILDQAATEKRNP